MNHLKNINLERKCFVLFFLVILTFLNASMLLKDKLIKFEVYIVKKIFGKYIFIKKIYQKKVTKMYAIQLFKKYV